MQVNQENIQRPSLFSDFFNLELMWNNEYLTYIQTSVKNVTSTIHKTVNTTIYNIKNSLKTAKNQHSALIILGKGMKKLQRELRASEECGKKNMKLRTEMREIHNLRVDARNPQSQND